MDKILTTIEDLFDKIAQGFIIYLIVGEIFFMTAGIIIPTFIF